MDYTPSKEYLKGRFYNAKNVKDKIIHIIIENDDMDLVNFFVNNYNILHHNNNWNIFIEKKEYLVNKITHYRKFSEKLNTEILNYHIKKIKLYFREYVWCEMMEYFWKPTRYNIWKFYIEDNIIDE
jgi:hypothetical protein